MIKVLKPGQGVYAPAIVCDHCGQPINNGKGNFLWNANTENDITEIYFTHKGCDKHFREALLKQGINTLWMDRDRFLLSLVNNAKVDFKRVKQDQDLWKEAGL